MLILPAIITNFSVAEILQGWEVPEDLHPNIFPTLTVLQHLRTDYGKPIFISSVYRDKTYNKGVGGKSKSLHLVFNAIDFFVEKSNDLKMLYNKLNKWDESGYFKFLPKPGSMGLGLYERQYFIHLDTRGVLNREAPARWKG